MSSHEHHVRGYLADRQTRPVLDVWWRVRMPRPGAATEEHVPEARGDPKVHRCRQGLVYGEPTYGAGDFTCCGNIGTSSTLPDLCFLLAAIC